MGFRLSNKRLFTVIIHRKQVSEWLQRPSMLHAWLYGAGTPEMPTNESAIDLLFSVLSLVENLFTVAYADANAWLQARVTLLALPPGHAFESVRI